MRVIRCKDCMWWKNPVKGLVAQCWVHDGLWVAEDFCSAAVIKREAEEPREEPTEMNIKLEPGAYLPVRAHKSDAGLDLRAFDYGAVPPHGSRVFRTGLHVQLPKGTAGLLVSKSGLNTKYNITSTGLIDEGYTGEIMVKLYNHGDEEFWVDSGDKISQLVVIPVISPGLHLTEHLKESERGDGGFGSTGR